MFNAQSNTKSDITVFNRVEGSPWSWIVWSDDDRIHRAFCEVCFFTPAFPGHTVSRQVYQPFRIKIGEWSYNPNCETESMEQLRSSILDTLGNITRRYLNSHGVPYRDEGRDQFYNNKDSELSRLTREQAKELAKELDGWLNSAGSSLVKQYIEEAKKADPESPLNMDAFPYGDDVSEISTMGKGIRYKTTDAGIVVHDPLSWGSVVR